MRPTITSPARIAYVVLLTTLLSCLGCNSKQAISAPVAHDGVLRLESWSLVDHGPVELRGTWLYYDRLLADVPPTDVPGTPALMPSYLNQSISPSDTVFDAQGFGTLHLRIEGIEPTAKGGPLGLSLPFVYTSARWVVITTKGESTDTTTFRAGIVGDTPSRAVPRLRPGVIPIQSGEQIDILLEVSNHDSSWIGPGDIVVLGTHEDLRKNARHQYIISIVLLSLLVLTSINQVFLFAIRPEDKTALWFALFAAAMSAVLMVRFLNEELGETGRVWFDFALRTPYVASELVAIATLLFCQEILGTLPKRATRGLIATIALLIALGVFAPLEILDGPGLTLFMAVAAAFTLLLTIGLVRALQRSLALEEKILVVGIIVLVGTMVYDTLVAGGFVEPPYIVSYGVALLVLCQSILLTVRSEYARQTAEYLSMSLREEVNLRTKDLAEKTRQAEEARASLEILDREKTRFFQNISHELRTPLTLILSPLDSLPVNPSHQDELDLIQRNSRRLLRLVNQLLDFQKVRATGHQLNLTPVDLAAFLRSSVHYFKLSCDKQNLSLTSHFNGSPLDDIVHPLFVMGEIDALEKILFNLLSNAFKFTPTGGFIRVETTMRGKMAHIQVVDSGPGIAKDVQSRLFEEFSQAEGSSHGKYEGTGLGLALVKQLTEAMGGTCGVESEFEQGSTFWFTVPITNEPAVEKTKNYQTRDWLLEDIGPSEPVSASELNVMPTQRPGGDSDAPLILIIDDLADMRRLLSEMLQGSGYRTLTAANGLVGLHLANQHTPDLILLDWMMPVMSGPQLIGKVREDPATSGIPIVMLTARSDWESRMAGGELGADAFLAKPFNQRELESTVHNLLQLKVGEHRLREANEALENFVNIASHDLRSPTATIENFANLLLGELRLDSSPSFRVPIEQIINLTQRMQSLIEALQGYARAKNQTIMLQDTPLEECVQHATQQLQSTLEESGAQLTVHPLPLVRCEAIFITEVFQNILGNAIKYNESKPPIIEIQAQEQGEMWLITVSDNGIGISPEHAEVIFKPFKRLQSSGQYRGSGLGLAFCSEIIRQHGGRVWVEQNETGGSRFCLTLSAGG